MTGEPPPYPGPPSGTASTADRDPAARPVPPLPPVPAVPEPPRLPPATPRAPFEQPDVPSRLGLPAHQDDLLLQSGRKHLKSRERGADGAAVLQLVVTLPTASISLGVVAIGGAMVNPVVGVVATVLWVLSGALVFHRPTETVIARRLLGMRRPGPAEAGRLAEVWEEVARRAGVRPGTYELWIQEREELNATATAGHIVAVTRHAMDRLPNSRLAAILAHELGHHVGGHTWAGMLADWYALPARTLRRLTVLVLARLVSSSDRRIAGCGGCLTLVVVAFVLAVAADLWWLLLPAALAPLLVAWLHRRAEYRADDYAVGLGFDVELAEVLAEEHRARTVAPAPPTGFSDEGTPQGQPEPAGAPRGTSAHADVKARLDRLLAGAGTAAGRPPAA
ncbi:M48 family metalloprotease [Kitasatospora sp. A2-31]|uniref:M48 family metalloprotease n=1 Tax=Kitasatospora sp. A2-31 TaxID=2916414 RepID=UPI001EEBC526|nr:M48 family metalloprotease [Kitasatospora sp. A2-31]MCG6495503.1 M48 family metalloprotease [Kitasatospora sp. A2-31]